MHLKIENFETFLKEISKEMNLKIDPNSFDRDILFALFKNNNFFKKEYEKILNSLIFENMKGNDLDNFLSFFNIFRKREKDEDLIDISVIYNSNKSFTINSGCRIRIENQNYKVLKSVSINGKDIINVQKSFDEEIVNQLSSKNGEIIFDKDFISTNGDFQEEASKVILIGINKNIIEEESDFEFLERTKSILQNLGLNNQEKIKNEILKDNRIKNVKIQEEENTCNIVIYPKNTDDLDEIIATNKHIVEYYKDRVIELIKPNLITIDIVGLAEQISFFPDYNNAITNIINEMKNYLNTLFIEENKITVKKIDIILLIREYFSKIKSIDIDYNLIEIQYNFHFRNNYNSPIFSNNIAKELDIDDNTLVSFGKVI